MSLPDIETQTRNTKYTTHSTAKGEAPIGLLSSFGVGFAVSQRHAGICRIHLFADKKS